MSCLDKGNRMALAGVLAFLLVGLWLSACDEPPTAPEPSVDIDEKQKALRQKVEQTQSEAKSQIDQVAEQFPDGDAGQSDTASSAEH